MGVGVDVGKGVDGLVDDGKGVRETVVEGKVEVQQWDWESMDE